MVLPSSGPIDLGSIQTEFGGTNPIGINEYYRNGGLVPSNNTNVPTSGTISLANFYGAINEIVKYIATTSTNVNASSYFTAGEWASSAPKRLIINSGVTIGATNTSNYALNIPSGFGGAFRLVNNGSIQGAGGAVNSGTGGNAIFAGAAISIDNQGTIYSGGGGGGLGGTGGQGVVTTSQWVYQGEYYQTGTSSRFISWTYPAGSIAGTYGLLRWNGNYNYGGNPGVPASGYKVVGNERFANGYYVGYTYGIGYIYAVKYEVFTTTNTITNGGAGGAGGRGRGYDGALAAGSAGSAGGTNAGTGGTGGTGGDWGTSGNTGSTGANGNYTSGLAGTSGGSAGFYIVNNGNVTWIANGTRAGRIG